MAEQCGPNPISQLTKFADSHSGASSSVSNAQRQQQSNSLGTFRSKQDSEENLNFQQFSTVRNKNATDFRNSNLLDGSFNSRIQMISTGSQIGSLYNGQQFNKFHPPISGVNENISKFKSQSKIQNGLAANSTQVDNWATEFASLSMNNTKMEQRENMINTNISNQRFNPSLPLNSSMSLLQPRNIQMNMNKQVNENEAQKKAFDEAFQAIDESLNSRAGLKGDEIKQEEKQEIINEVLEDDELSKTAGMLLDSLKNDTSKKFKESSFMSLMQKIRDHEIVVKDNDLVESEKAKDSNKSTLASDNVSNNTIDAQKNSSDIIKDETGISYYENIKIPPSESLLAAKEWAGGSCDITPNQWEEIYDPN